MKQFMRQRGGCPPQAGRHVLLVDDHDLVLSCITKQLRKRGFTVVGVSTGAEALRMLAGAAFDAMVTDIMLPGPVAGLSLALEARRRCPAITVVVLSGYPELVCPGTSANGGITILPKPFATNDLVGILEPRA